MCVRFSTHPNKEVKISQLKRCLPPTTPLHCTARIHTHVYTHTHTHTHTHKDTVYVLYIDPQIQSTINEQQTDKTHRTQSDARAKPTNTITRVQIQEPHTLSLSLSLSLTHTHTHTHTHRHTSQQIVSIFISLLTAPCPTVHTKLSHVIGCHLSSFSAFHRLSLSLIQLFSPSLPLPLISFHPILCGNPGEWCVQS